MKDLRTKQLKQSFRENILSALKESERRDHDVKILLKFSDNSDHEFKDVKIYTIYNRIYFQDVELGSLKDNYVLDIIINNLWYDYFSFIKKDFKIGRSNIEHPAVDEYIFVYHRFED